MIAALLSWHDHNLPAASEIERRLERGEELVLAAPTLVETYSVLTRFPPRRRLAPDRARALLEGAFLAQAIEIVALDAASYRRLVTDAPEQGTVGGRIYDAVIVACALAAEVDTILTFNERQFVPLAAGAIKVVVPSV
jgi:predicted nucleic acid-binding protein